MNYKAELRGFALQNAIKIVEVAGYGALGLADQMPDDIFKAAEKIVDYLYILEKDIKSHIDTLIPLIVQSGDIEKMDQFILELQQIQAEMVAGIKKPEAN